MDVYSVRGLGLSVDNQVSGGHYNRKTPTEFSGYQSGAKPEYRKQDPEVTISIKIKLSGGRRIEPHVS